MGHCKYVNTNRRNRLHLTRLRRPAQIYSDRRWTFICNSHIYTQKIKSALLTLLELSGVDIANEVYISNTNKMAHTTAQNNNSLHRNQMPVLLLLIHTSFSTYFSTSIFFLFVINYFSLFCRYLQS